MAAAVVSVSSLCLGLFRLKINLGSCVSVGLDRSEGNIDIAKEK